MSEFTELFLDNLKEAGKAVVSITLMFMFFALALVLVLLPLLVAGKMGLLTSMVTIGIGVIVTVIWAIIMICLISTIVGMIDRRV